MKRAAAVAVVSPVAAKAQQAGTVYRIGYLTVPGRESGKVRQTAVTDAPCTVDPLERLFAAIRP